MVSLRTSFCCCCCFFLFWANILPKVREKKGAKRYLWKKYFFSEMVPWIFFVLLVFYLTEFYVKKYILKCELLTPKVFNTWTSSIYDFQRNQFSYYSELATMFYDYIVFFTFLCSSAVAVLHYRIMCIPKSHHSSCSYFPAVTCLGLIRLKNHFVVRFLQLVIVSILMKL